jgi:hypothetical protein
LFVPEYGPENPRPYPGDLQPGEYRGSEVVGPLREHADNPDAIRFIADMLEE